MKIILTGITGNIGYDVARILLREGHIVVPVIRHQNEETIDEKLKKLHADFSQIGEYISANLEEEVLEHSLTDIDCIIHCAGVVHFKKAGSSNEQIMKNLVAFVKNTSTPIYYVSTAYLYKPNNEPLFNQYEEDKQKAENVLISSSLPYTILRPSIVTGNSETGSIIHFSGYYLTVPAFVGALKKADRIRFPNIQNTVNIIPVDWVARSIVDAVKDKKKETLYITNPNPPTFSNLLKDTLKYFLLYQKIELVDCTFEEYRNLDLTPVEKELLNFCDPFIPYLTTNYDFPDSVCASTLNPNYIGKILGYAVKFQNERMEK